MSMASADVSVGYGVTARQCSPIWLRIPVLMMTASLWISMAAFAVYILIHFGGAVLAGHAERWNAGPSDLLRAGAPLSNSGIFLHFMGGALLLLLGPVQLIGSLRDKAPAIHRVTGRIFGVAAVATGLGGLTYIAAGGTIGGPVMNTGFALYGLLILGAGVLTPLHAMRGAFERHRAWAIRLFALAIASWLYRIEYGLILTLNDHRGHTDDFRGWFDYLMAFGFYIPNLLIAEGFIRAPVSAWPTSAKVGLAMVSLALALVIGFGTLIFVTYEWGPKVVDDLQVFGRQA